MKTLKVKLFDDKEYKFSTLPLSKSKSVTKLLQKQTPEMKEVTKLEAKEEKEGLSVEELEKLEGLEDIVTEQNIQSIFMVASESLKRFHPEFKIDENNKKQVYANLADLLDMDVGSTVIQFALTGKIPRREALDLGDNEINLDG